MKLFVSVFPWLSSNFCTRILSLITLFWRSRYYNSGVLVVKIISLWKLSDNIKKESCDACTPNFFIIPDFFQKFSRHISLLRCTLKWIKLRSFEIVAWNFASILFKILVSGLTFSDNTLPNWRINLSLLTHRLILYRFFLNRFPSLREILFLSKEPCVRLFELLSVSVSCCWLGTRIVRVWIFTVPSQTFSCSVVLWTMNESLRSFYKVGIHIVWKAIRFSMACFPPKIVCQSIREILIGSLQFSVTFSAEIPAVIVFLTAH